MTAIMLGSNWGSLSPTSFVCGDDRSLKGLAGFILIAPIGTC